MNEPPAPHRYLQPAGIANPAGIHKSRPAELGGISRGVVERRLPFFIRKPLAESYISIDAIRLFSEIRFMTAEDLDGIIAKARKGEHTEFSLIKNHRSYAKAKAY